jgi:hypothetical protein
MRPVAGKVPVYAGYNFMGSNPSCFARVELVHSQSPPIPLWPARVLPLPVTAMGCQLLNPTLAPSKLVKSSCELSPCFEGWDGGLSSTPSLMRCLQLLVNFSQNSTSHSHTH